MHRKMAFRCMRGNHQVVCAHLKNTGHWPKGQSRKEARHGWGQLLWGGAYFKAAASKECMTTELFTRMVCE